MHRPSNLARSVPAVLAIAFVLATPVSGQEARKVERDSQPEGRAKIDAITIKQKTAAAVDVFLKIEGIKGESADKGHKSEIAVESWSWGASQAGATAPVRARPASGPGTLTLVVPRGQGSAQLAVAATARQEIERMTLTFPPEREGGNPLTVTLENVMVTSAQRSGTRDRPTETFSLNFEKLR
jgi:type VI secretion system secreted protein Hcp